MWQKAYAYNSFSFLSQQKKQCKVLDAATPSLVYKETLRDLFIRTLTPCHYLANIPPTATATGLPHRSPLYKHVDFAHFIWKRGKESSGPEGLLRVWRNSAKGHSEAGWRPPSVPWTPSVSLEWHSETVYKREREGIYWKKGFTRLSKWCAVTLTAAFLHKWFTR